ncbi:MAG: HAD family hydrolase [Prevotellaceae bacterium]|jgi:D-glycero-D-manno-heptose 1,7-bisphosphate phosphatase|nr:HAD family hydrolase [Prevotellaceae bacterium]
MNKAIFLDRDGVINDDEGRYYVFRKEDFKLTPQLGEQLKVLQDKGYLLIVITNQGGVARGEYTLAEVEMLNGELRKYLQAFGVKLAEVYACPHHTDYGKCLCRKPQPLMIQKAMARFNVDPAQSYFVGDRDSDMQTAGAAGVTGILVERNAGLKGIAALVK